MIEIITNRLIIREHKAEDLDGYHKWMSDPEVMKYVYGFSRTLSKQESLERLTEAINSSLEDPRIKYYAAITLKESQVYIGSCGGIIRKKEINGGILGMGYFLIKEYWNYGYATEAVKAWIDYCFGSMDIHKIMAGCDIENKSSENIMIKCGMKKESELRKHRYRNGIWSDGLQYSILRDEWELYGK